MPPGYAIPFWTAIFAPVGAPKEIVERIAAETNKAMKHPEVLRRYGEIGVVGVGSSPQELDPFLAPAARLPGQDREGRKRRAGEIVRDEARPELPVMDREISGDPRTELRRLTAYMDAHGSISLNEGCRAIR